MRKILGICLSAVTVVASMVPAHAGWRKVDTSSSGDTYYFDAQRVVKIGNGVQYWYKVVKSYPDYQGIKSYTLKMEGDCMYRKARALEGRFHDAQGKSLGTQAFDEYPRYVMSGTYDEYFLQQACGGTSY